MRILVFLAIPAIVFCACCLPVTGQEQGPGEQIERLRFRFEVEVAELHKPIKKLNLQYTGYLKKQKETYQQAGKLEPMLAVESELKTFASAMPGEALSPHAELKRLQQIYRNQRGELERKNIDAKLALIQKYRKTFDQLAVAWTKSGEIEGAKLALSESKKLAEMEQDPSLLQITELPAPSSESTDSSISSFSRQKAGDEWTNSIGMTLCWIPPGKFKMRDSRVDAELTKPFWIGKYEVTQEEYQKVIGKNPSVFKESGLRAPVENIHVHEAEEFCEKLTAMDRDSGALPKGWKYSLPTEAQWEYACRAGTKGNYNVDKTALRELGWFKDNSEEKTHEVGQKQPNAWGLYDMHGNVREWTADWNRRRFEGGKDPVGPETGEPGWSKVLRGGGWSYDAGFCRSAHLMTLFARHRRSDTGFRVAIVPVEPVAESEEK